MEFTTGEETESKEPGKKVLSGEELSKQLDRFLEDKANNQRIRDWVEVCVAASLTLDLNISRGLLFFKYKA